MNFAKYRVQLSTEKKYSSKYEYKYEYEYSIPATDMCFRDYCVFWKGNVHVMRRQNHAAMF